MEQISQSARHRGGRATDLHTDQNSADSLHPLRSARSTSIKSQVSIRSAMTAGPVIGRHRLEL